MMKYPKDEQIKSLTVDEVLEKKVELTKNIQNLIWKFYLETKISIYSIDIAEFVNDLDEPHAIIVTVKLKGI